MVSYDESLHPFEMLFQNKIDNASAYSYHHNTESWTNNSILL